MGKIIGIDLGTTNSCVAIFENGETKVIPNAEGNRTTPSVVAFTKNGETLVGQTAKRQAVTNPKNTIFSIKRFMGRKFSEVKKEKDLVPYEVVEASNGDAHVKVNGKIYSPPEISAIILRKLKTDAEAYLGEEITEAIITVPAYFNDSQRQATKDAGRIAGLDVKRIINEPTAASLAYGLDKKKDEIICIVDLGGGTWDVSLLEIGEGVFEVKATNGDTHLGGDDFDKAIIDWLLTEFKQETGINLQKDPQAVQRLKETAEKAKCELSSAQKTEINLPFITADSSGPKHLVKELSRAKLEQLTDFLIEKMRPSIDNCIKDSGISKDKIDEIILVGGQSRMPKFQDFIQKIFNKELHKGVNPDEVVAIGAAVQGGVLGGQVTDILLLDVTPLSLGIETLGGVMTRLIERNTTIPTKKTETFSTAADNQPAVDIHILQGEREFAKDNKSLGKFQLDGIPPAPRGVPKIEVAFDIDANGIIHVSAKDLGTGKEQKIKITANSGLSETEIEKMVKDGEINAKKDKEEREKIEIINKAENIVYTAEKQLKENNDKIPSELKNQIESKISELKTALSSKNIDKIKESLKNLEEFMLKIGEAIYSQNTGNNTNDPENVKSTFENLKDMANGKNNSGPIDAEIVD